jgi:tRNA pseudouridine65 synthase
LKEDFGDWSEPLTNRSEGARNPRGRKAERVHAHTRYRVVGRNDFLTKAEFTLETGRQHQIRKHAAVNRHQIVGDRRYGDRRYNRMMSERYSFGGMTLHSHRLSLVIDGVLTEFKASEPAEWAIFNLG